MRGNNITKRKIILLILSALAAALCICAVCVHLWYESLKTAKRIPNGWEINGAEYVYADYREIGPYKETYTLICRSVDGDFDFYEIAEYPGREYIVERVFYEAEVLKRK